MKTYSFLNRQLSAKQRQAMEQRKRFEQSNLQAKEAFNQSINQAIEKAYSIEEVEDYYKFKLSRNEGFTGTPCLCQVLDDDELNNFKDHTRGYPIQHLPMTN